MTDDGLRVARFHDLRLPSGLELEFVDQAFRLEGTPREDGSNVILLFHSLTGTPNPRDWWGGLVHRGRALDPERWALLTPNLIGSCYGTRARLRAPEGTGTASATGGDAPGSPDPWPSAGGEARPEQAGPGQARPEQAGPDQARPEQAGPGFEGSHVSVRDMVHLTALLLDHLGIESVRLATGGSLGGMASLEWAASYPDRARSAIVFAAPAAHTAQAIGFSRIQRALLRLGGPVEGLKLAREAAMLTYRTAREMEGRFGRRRREDGLFQIESYLERHGEKLAARFHPESYRLLLDAMDGHDVAFGRGSVAEALAGFEGDLTGVGIPGDLLYRTHDVKSWTEAVGAHYREIRSRRGHDAFLIELRQTGAIIEEVLERTEPAP